MREVTIPVTFRIGTIGEIGLGGLKVLWVSSETDDGTEYSLFSGAGVGSSLMEGAIKRSGKYLHAEASIRGLAEELFNHLRTALAEQEAAGG